MFLAFRRVRDKYESELKELEESERNMQEKYNNMKVRNKHEFVSVSWGQSVLRVQKTRATLSTNQMQN